MHESFQALLSLVIPEGVSDYFKLVNYTKESGSIHIYLEEINTSPVIPNV
jgi:transposase